MATFSYYLHAKLLNWLKGTAFGTPPVSLHLALLTAAPNSDGTGLEEPPEDSGYTRVVFTLGAITTNAGISSVSNGAPVVLPAATRDWPSVTYGAVLDENEMMLAYGPLPSARAPKAGDAISFGAGALQLRVR